MKKQFTKRVSVILAVILTFAAQESNRTALASETVYTPSSGQTAELTQEQTPAVTSELVITQTPDPAQPVPADAMTPAPTVITPETALTPAPADAIPTPALTPAPTTITPNPNLTPTPTVITPSPRLTPTPTVSPYRSKTLERMSAYDYVSNSVTGLSSKKVDVKTLQKSLNSYGKLYGKGMPFSEYKAAMQREWVDETQYDKSPCKITVDIKKTMNYSTYVDILKKLSRYDGVYLYKIGKSTQGRDLYAIEVDMDSDVQKNVIMLTGEIHAREFAGGTFIVKELVDLVQKAQTDSKTMELLKNNKFVAVPIVNVDGREAIINAPGKWTTRDGLWKAYTNGTDGGRNFPGLQWGEVASGYRFKSLIASKPAYANYPGPYAGSNSETKAMMKWLYQYVVVEQADYYLDLHEQGSIVYAGKSWQTKSQEQLSRNLRTSVLSVINSGSSGRKYLRVYEGSSYGLQGEGSTLTDYAAGLAVGAKFSPAYGFDVFTDGVKEYPLLQVRDLDTTKVKVKAANKSFATITIEIGYGNSYLGNSAYTRTLLAKEYNKYNFGKLLESLAKTLK